MALTIIKTDNKGADRLIAEHDLYVDETGKKVIVVKDGEEVPREAATVLAGKGGTVPAKYADMLKALEGPPDPNVAGAPVPPSEPVAHVASTQETGTKPSAVEPSPELNKKLEPKAKPKQ